MLRKIKEQNRITFIAGDDKLSINNNEAAKITAKKDEEIGRDVREEQKSKKLNNIDNGYMTNHNVFSARTGAVTNMKGPSKFIKGETSNTIWENDKIERLAKEKDLRVQQREERENLETVRKQQERARISNMAEALKSTDQSKISTITPLTNSGSDSHRGHQASSSNISMFEQTDFERLPEKSAGEELSQRVQELRSQKDDSWKTNGKTVSSKDVVKNFFDNLMSEKK